MIISLWNRLSRLPLGRSLFGIILGWKVPYTGSICPEVLEITSGHARVQMKDRRRVRNHLNCIHAIALMNLGEVTTGLAVLSACGPDSRAILTHLEIDFLKKARGTLQAKADLDSPITPQRERQTLVVQSHLYNLQNEEVARVKAHWLIDSAIKSTQGEAK